MIARIEKQVFDLIDASHADDDASRAFNIGMMFLISLNVMAVILGTESSLPPVFYVFLWWFEVFSIAIFSVEYILRLWVCTRNTQYRHPVWGRLRYALTGSMLIDLVSILPFFVPAAGLDLRFIRGVRLFRLFRLFKMARYSESLTKLGNVLKAKRSELGVTLFSVCVLLIIASSLMYFLEREAQPEAFGSIASSMWWGVVTLTTVGYGDIYPHTILGKLLAGFIAVLGIGLFALPAGIIASGFAAEVQGKPPEVKLCPHCGKAINASAAS